MLKIKISELTAADELVGNEQFPLVQDSETVRSAVGVPAHALVNGDVAGNITVAAIKVGDRLDEVAHHIYTAGVTTDITDLTAEFAINADGKINNTGGTSSATNKLWVRWTKRTA